MDANIKLSEAEQRLQDAAEAFLSTLKDITGATHLEVIGYGAPLSMIAIVQEQSKSTGCEIRSLQGNGTPDRHYIKIILPSANMEVNTWKVDDLPF